VPLIDRKLRLRSVITSASADARRQPVDEELQGFDSASREALLSERIVLNDSMRSTTQL
jgi:hypothetical protein